MLKISPFISCNNCQIEFTEKNYPITLMCGHNFCKYCLDSMYLKTKVVCGIDHTSQEISNEPSIDYIYLIGLAKAIPNLYNPIHAEKKNSFSNKPIERVSVLDQKVCHFFLAGKCRFGNRCWNKHSGKF